eukprot:631513-Rhodomonas_salina.1
MARTCRDSRSASCRAHSKSNTRNRIFMYVHARVSTGLGVARAANGERVSCTAVGAGRYGFGVYPAHSSIPYASTGVGVGGKGAIPSQPSAT